MKSGRSLVELARELERQLGTKKDLLVPLPRTQYHTAEDGESVLEIDEPNGMQRYGITALARRQLAEKLKIPYAYFERMRTEQPALLDRNVNAWLEKEAGERQLLRTLDGRVRAVLSERYRRLGNHDLVEHLLPTLSRLPDARCALVPLPVVPSARKRFRMADADDLNWEDAMDREVEQMAANRHRRPHGRGDAVQRDVRPPEVD